VRQGNPHKPAAYPCAQVKFARDEKPEFGGPFARLQRSSGQSQTSNKGAAENQGQQKQPGSGSSRLEGARSTRKTADGRPTFDWRARVDVDIQRSPKAPVPCSVGILPPAAAAAHCVRQSSDFNQSTRQPERTPRARHGQRSEVQHPTSRQRTASQSRLSIA